MVRAARSAIVSVCVAADVVLMVCSCGCDEVWEGRRVVRFVEGVVLGANGERAPWEDWNEGAGGGRCAGVCCHVPGRGLGGVAMDAILQAARGELARRPLDSARRVAQRANRKYSYSMHGFKRLIRTHILREE